MYVDPQAARDSAKAYYRANAKRVSARNNVYRAAHLEEYRVYQKRWRDANPVAKAAQTMSRRALKKSAKGRGITRAQREKILETAAGRCDYCFEIHPIELDHIVSLNAGGEHDVNNAAACCRHCNPSKGDKQLLIWLLTKGI